MFGLTPEQLGIVTGIAGIVSAVIAGFGLPALVLGWHNHLARRLAENPVIRERLATALAAPSLSTLYATSLAFGLDRLERWMGGYRDLARGYGWCAAVAMAYAAAFILLPWGLAGSGTTFGDWVLIPDTVQPWWQRTAPLLALATAGCILVLLVRHEKRIEAWQAAAVRALLDRLGLRWSQRAVRVAEGLIVFALFLGILIGGRWLIGSDVTLGYVAGALAGALAVAVAGVGAFAFAVAVAVAVLALAISGLGLIDPSLALAFALLLAVLPLVNALLDWPSWLVSRWLGRHLLASLDGSRLRQLGSMALHGIADLVAAAAFLAALAVVLPRAVGLVVDLAPRLDPSFDAALGPFLCAAARDPLGAGFWATAMLLSTLLPTALHVMFLVASPLAFWLKPHGPDWQARAAYLAGDRNQPPACDLPNNPTLRPGTDGQPALNPETVRKVVWWRIRQICLIYPTALIVAGLLLWAVWHLIQLATGSLPAWLLWLATFDTPFVEACLPAAF